MDAAGETVMKQTRPVVGAHMGGVASAALRPCCNRAMESYPEAARRAQGTDSKL